MASSKDNVTCHLCPEGVFGEPRPTAPYAAVTSTDFTYTGQRDLPGTGLMDYKARFYSPALKRFIQPDSLILGTRSQSKNRYSYVGNNPINANDPSGHICVGEPGECLKNDGTASGGFGGGTPPPPTAPLPSGPPPAGPGNDPEHPHGNGGGGDSGGQSNNSHDHDSGGVKDPSLNIEDNFNYFVGSNKWVYQYHSFQIDAEFTGQFGLFYDNNSPYTVVLSPTGINLIDKFYETGTGFSLNQDAIGNIGYGQSLPYNIISSVSGINVNPITETITSRVSEKIYGPLSYRQLVGMKITVRPLEMAATVAAAVAVPVAAYYYSRFASGTGPTNQCKFPLPSGEIVTIPC